MTTALKSNVVVTDAEGLILAVFKFDAIIDAGRDARKAAALRAAVEFVGYDIPATGRTGNGTIYRSETHEIGFLNSGCNPIVGEYL